MSCNTSLDSKWHIVIAQEHDIEAAVSGLSGHMNDEQRRKFRDKLNRYVRKGDRDLVLALQGDRVIGFYTVIDYDDLPPEVPASISVRVRDYACGTGFMVHPDCRRQGIGMSLHERVEHWARQRGKPGFWLSTRRQANWFHKHFGFDEIARVMVKGIERRIMAKDFGAGSYYESPN